MRGGCGCGCCDDDGGGVGGGGIVRDIEGDWNMVGVSVVCFLTWEIDI